MFYENEGEAVAELKGSISDCEKALDALAGGKHYRDHICEALERAKDALVAELAARERRASLPCRYCKGTGTRET